jgi:hypothetical protein
MLKLNIDQVKDDISFLLSFVPATHPDDIEEDMFSSYYMTGSYDTEVELINRVRDIVVRYEIDHVEDIL